MNNKYIIVQKWNDQKKQNSREKKDVEFFTSTETTLQLLITRDQVWPRVSIPCFLEHPSHANYILERCFSRYCSFHLAIHVFVPSPQKQSHAKRHQRKQSIHTRRYSCIVPVYRRHCLDYRRTETTNANNQQNKHEIKILVTETKESLK